ncbi:MAG TPA: ornithine carbamoyltransferase [Thermoanaerobaculia bacterium]|nr:ornithine carbamoyltransferase [Thermoanaerobaculia bacterium]
MDSLKNRDFLGLKDFKAAELEHLLELAAAMKAGQDRTRYLEGKTLGTLFTVPSTRTRISFQVAARQLGAYADHYSPAELQMSNNESLIDTAAVMSRYLDAIVVRLYDMSAYGQGRQSLLTMAEHSAKPVVNALDDKEHPCQVMADFLTLKERFGADYKKKKVVFTWAYAKRQKSPGVTHSIMTAAGLLGANLTVAFPPGFEPDEEYTAFALEAARRSGGRIEFSHDLNEACEGADVIYAKSWKSLRSTTERDRELRERARPDWCVSQSHFDRANPGAVFMDCMPLIRGDEATADVVDGPQSIRYDEAENRLHIQKAILASILQ